MLLNCGVGEDSWESLGLHGDPTSAFWRRSALGLLWKEWCYSWNSSTLATPCKELTHWKRLWCWEGLGAGGEGDNRGWDGWMASLTRWMWVWVNSGSWWWTGRPGVLWFMGSQKVGHDWATELNWTDHIYIYSYPNICICKHLYACIYLYSCVYMYTCIHMCLYSYTCVSVYIYNIIILDCILDKHNFIRGPGLHVQSLSAALPWLGWPLSKISGRPRPPEFSLRALLLVPPSLLNHMTLLSHRTLWENRGYVCAPFG